MSLNPIDVAIESVDHFIPASFNFTDQKNDTHLRALTAQLYDMIRINKVGNAESS